MSRLGHPTQRFVAVALAVLSLACSGWLSTEADMIGVERDLAVDQGYVVPVEASKVFVRDRKLDQETVRTTWFRYRLPSQNLTALRQDLAGDSEIEFVGDWSVPDTWPDFASIGFESPTWWSPKGQTFRQQLTPEKAVRVPGGQQWAIDTEDGEVYIWIWEWEGWAFEARAGGLDPEPAPEEGANDDALPADEAPSGEEGSP